MGPMLPPQGMTAYTTDDSQASDYSTRKPEINSSLMPMISYIPDQSVADGIEHAQGEKTVGRRMSEMDIMAAITQLAPDVEAGPGTPGVGGRKDMDDSVL